MQRALKSVASVFLSLTAAFCAGCLSSSAPEATAWTLETPAASRGEAVPSVEGAQRAAFGTTRMGTVAVDAPFDKTSFVVRRADGSVAFDDCNVFAALPASLVRAPVRDRLGADGRFGRVVNPSSTAWADAQVEVQITDLSLDCRTAGQRRARAALALDVVKTGRGPRVVALRGTGAGEADAAGGDYSAAFSGALDAALTEALKSLKTVEATHETAPSPTASGK